MGSAQTGDIDQRKAYRGLAWLALGNIVCAAILATGHDLLRNYDSRGNFVVELVVQHIPTVRFATISGQVLAWAIISALIPRRRFFGLIWSIAMAVALGTINWLSVVIQDPGSAVATASYVWASCVSLAVFAIAQGLRFLLGWRVALRDEQPATRGGQFGIADLIEWTASIGIFFGLGHLGGWFQYLPQFAIFIAWQSLVSLPIALAVLSRRGLRWVWVLVAACAGFAASAIFVIWNGYFDSAGVSRLDFLQHILALTTSYLSATALNFAVVRRLGFRWLTRARSGGRAGQAMIS